jgi:hypothetical protein
MDYMEKSGVCQGGENEMFNLIKYRIHRSRKLLGETNRLIKRRSKHILEAALPPVPGGETILLEYKAMLYIHSVFLVLLYLQIILKVHEALEELKCCLMIDRSGIFLNGRIQIKSRRSKTRSLRSLRGFLVVSSLTLGDFLEMPRVFALADFSLRSKSAAASNGWEGGLTPFFQGFERKSQIPLDGP